jgi:hypothetical protein
MLGRQAGIAKIRYVKLTMFADFRPLLKGSLIPGLRCSNVFTNCFRRLRGGSPSVSSIEAGDRKAILALRQELTDAVARAHALGWAIVRLEGRTDEDRLASAVRETVLSLLGELDPTPPPNVVNFRKPESRASEASPASGLPENPSAQELLLESLRGQEVSIRDLQTVLEDYGLQVSPGNLSVILSRMNQSGLIQRTGRGIYRASH